MSATLTPVPVPRLGGDPGRLLEVAEQLRRHAAAADEVGAAATRQAAALSTTWQGTAELTAASKAADVRHTLTTLGEQLRTVADGLVTRAGTLRIAQAELARAAAASDAAALAGDVPASYRAAAGGEAVADADRGSSRALALVLHGSTPAEAFPGHADREATRELGEVTPAIQALWTARQRFADLVTATVKVRALGIAYGDVGTAAAATSRHTRIAAAALERIEATRAAVALGDDPLKTGLLAKATKVVTADGTRWHGVSRFAEAVASSRVGVLATRAGAGGVAVEGAVDLARGDPEHAGWRDGATRVMGAVGVGGGVALAVGVANPVGATVAVGAVAGYGAWKAGCAVYDNWPAIKAGAIRSGRRVLDAGRRTREAVTRGARAFLDGPGGRVFSTQAGWNAGVAGVF